MAIPDNSEEDDRGQDCPLGETIQYDLGQNLTLRVGENNAAGPRQDISIRESGDVEAISLRLKELVLAVITLLLSILIDAKDFLYTPQASASQVQNPPRSISGSSTQTCYPEPSEHACGRQNDSEMSKCLSKSNPQANIKPHSVSLTPSRCSSRHEATKQRKQQRKQPGNIVSRPQQGHSNECPLDQQPSVLDDQRNGSDESIESNLCEQPERSSVASSVSHTMPSSLIAPAKPIHIPRVKKNSIAPTPSNQHGSHVNTGLFYSGTNGRETCLFCHGRLRICDNLDPLEDHARRFPECLFIRWRYREPDATLSSGEV